MCLPLILRMEPPRCSSERAKGDKRRPATPLPSSERRRGLFPHGGLPLRHGRVGILDRQTLLGTGANHPGRSPRLDLCVLNARSAPVEAVCLQRNTASARVLEKLGFRLSEVRSILFPKTSEPEPACFFT